MNISTHMERVKRLQRKGCCENEEGRNSSGLIDVDDYKKNYHSLKGNSSLKEEFYFRQHHEELELCNG